MRWITSILLHLSLGVIIGLVILLMFGINILPASGEANIAPWLALAMSMIAGIAIAFIAIDSIDFIWWRKVYIPIAEGQKSLEFDGEETVKKALRGINSVFAYPSLARHRTVLFINMLSATLLRRKIKVDWMWPVHAFAWREISRYPSLLDETRAALAATDALNDTAWQVGLALLRERPDDVGLAVLLGRSGLTRDLTKYPPEHLDILEKAWLAAYREEEALKPALLPPLAQRFIATQRRDEVAARLYIDAYHRLSVSAELIREMRKTADAIENTGGNQDLIDTLRNLANKPEDSGQRIPGSHVDAMKDFESSFESRPGSSYDSESTESVTKNLTDHAVFVFDDDQSRTESVSRTGRLKRNRRKDVSDQTSAEEDQGASWPPDIEDVRAKMVRWLWIAIGLITAIVAAVILWFAL